MPKSRRVVITGLGVVAPNGIGKDTFWDALVAGKSAVDFVTAFDPSLFPCRVAAEVRDFNPADFMRSRRAKHSGRFSQFAVAAAKLAVEDSQVHLHAEDPERVHLCIGTALNGAGDVYETARVAYQKSGLAGIHTSSSTEFAAHAPVGHVSAELNLRGPSMTMASACTTGLDVIQWACDRIRENGADIVLAGSTEAPISEFCFATLCAVGALSNFNDPPLRAARPYDLLRDGLVLGEGAAVCVVEELEHALARGASIYAEVLGFGSGNGGGFSGNKQTSEQALRLAIEMALSRAGKTPDSIDYINAHGNAIREYDLMETRTFRQVFGGRAYNIPVSSIKSMIGHAMGAAASFQVVAACLAIAKSVLPPTINYEIPDPECDLDYVPNEARVCRVRTALVNAHAVGETHSVLALGAPDL